MVESAYEKFRAAGEGFLPKVATPPDCWHLHLRAQVVPVLASPLDGIGVAEHVMLDPLFNGHVPGPTKAKHQE
jgi:hypothetical protein